MVAAEKELRQSWSDRYEKETRTLSQLNVEMLSMKGSVSEGEGKLRHLQVELLNEERMSESLMKSKKELMDTLNRYVVQCEMMEKDVYAMKEVNKHFDRQKQVEFREMKGQVAKLN